MADSHIRASNGALLSGLGGTATGAAASGLSASGGAPAASGANIFSAFAPRGGGGGGGGGKPLDKKTLVVIGTSPHAPRLAELARGYGATVVELRQGGEAGGSAGGGGAGGAGVPLSVPMTCSAAVFADAAAIDDGFESLAVLAAGLYPLRPSYLERLTNSSKQPLPAAAHEWAVGAGGTEAGASGGGGVARAHALLAQAARRRTRLFEKWCVAVVPGVGGGGGAPGEVPILACPFSEAEVQAVLVSGGARLAAPSEADILLVPDVEAASEHLQPSHSACYLLGDWYRFLQGEMALQALQGRDLRTARTGAAAAAGEADEAAGPHAAAGAAAGSRAARSPAAGHERAAAQASAAGGGQAGKRRTRHSAAEPSHGAAAAAAAAPSKRSRAA